MRYLVIIVLIWSSLLQAQTIEKSVDATMQECKALMRTSNDQYPGRVRVIRQSDKYLEFRIFTDDGAVTVVCANNRMVFVRH